MAEIAVGAAVAIKAVIGGALTSVGVGATTAYGIGSVVATTVTSAGFLFSVAAAAVSALTPEVGASGSPTEWRSDPDAPIPFVIGENASAGFIVHRDEWGSDNRYQSIVTVYSGAGPIQAFGTYTADGAAQTFAGAYGRQNTGTWKDIFWRDTKLGAQPDTALQPPDQKGDPTIGGTMPAWSSSYKLSGKACDMVTMAMDKNRERWPTGEPKPLQVIQGLLVWDPREDDTYPGGSGSCRLDDPSTWVYSENPYLHALKWCLGYYENGVLVGGIGASQSGIDVAAFVEGANIAEANGWLVSGRPTTADDKHQVLQAMLQAGGGRYARKGGKISCLVRAPRTSVATVSAADTAGPFSIDINSDRLARLNTVTPRCVMASHDWEMVAQDPVTVPAYVTADGGVRADGFDYPYVAIKANNVNQHQPAQLAAYDIVDSRETIRGTVPLKPYMAQIEPGDVFTIDEPGFLLDGVECLCVKRTFDPAQDIVQVTFVSETAGKHDFALGLNPTPPSPPGLTAPDVYTVPAPGVSVWAGAASTGNNPAVSVTGEADNESIRAVRIEIRPYLDPADGLPWDDDDSGWRVVGEYQPGTAKVDITGLEPSTQYQVAVSYISQFGVLGDRRILDTVTTGTMVADDATGPTAAIDAARDAINDAQGRADATLADAAGKLAEAAETGLQDSLLNWIEDPTGSDGWVADDGGFIIGKTTGFKAMWPSLVAGQQTTKVLWFPHEKAVKPGVLVQAGVEVAVEGVASEAILEAVWYDAAGSVLATEAMDNAVSGRLSDVVQAPALAATVRFRLVPNASTSGQGIIAVSEPFAAFARPGQTVADAFQDPASETRSRFLSIERSMGEMAGSVRQSLTENRRARAVITQTMATQVGQDSAIAAAKTEVLSTVSSTYLTQATAADTYYTEAQVNNAIATYQITVGAVTDTISAHVNLNAGAITEIEGGAAYFSVAVAAGGGNPAIYEMIAGKDGSAISLGGDALYFVNTVGGTSIKAMEVVSGDVRISNDLYVDNAIIMAAGGAIRGGASGYLTGTGFFLGYDGSAYKLSVGNPAGQYMAWDGATLAITGDFTRSFGASGLLTMGDLGGGRTGFEILNSAGVEAFYVDDTGAMRLNGDALPTTRAPTAPPTPAPGEWWFDTSSDTQYRWGGSGWDEWGTIGAIWDTNVTGRPIELTDGRISAGLDANGDLNRNITNSRATASDLLRRTGGGLFSGDLNATLGATWGNNVASIPSNLASLTGAESILNSGISIAANGSLSGGGGGQVTIAGLGYTGALNANYITNTNELTDGAGLGNTAAWGSVSGRPANLSSLSGGESILNSGITIGANGALTGGGGGQVTLGGLGAGTLATKSSVSDTELAGGKALIQTQSGAPTPTSVRLVQDITTGVVYADDGTSARRVSQDVYTNTGGTQAINSTTAGVYEVVAKVALEDCDENTLVGFNGSSIGYSSATANASSAAVEGQWAVIASATETAEGSTINTNVVGSSQVLAVGATAGLKYFQDGADILEQSSDFVSNVSPKFLDGSITGGTVYIHLGLRVSSGSGTINAGSCLLRVPRLS